MQDVMPVQVMSVGGLDHTAWVVGVEVDVDGNGDDGLMKCAGMRV